MTRKVSYKDLPEIGQAIFRDYLYEFLLAKREKPDSEEAKMLFRDFTIAGSSMRNFTVDLTTFEIEEDIPTGISGDSIRFEGLKSLLNSKYFPNPKFENDTLIWGESGEHTAKIGDYLISINDGPFKVMKD